MLYKNQVLQDEPKYEADNTWDGATSLFLAPETLFSRDDGFSLKGVRGVLNRDRFLSELNRFRDYPGKTFKLTPGGALVDGIRYRKAVVSPNAQLRMYVDEWLDTGVEQGTEDPRRRDLTAAPNACWAVRRFADKQKFRLEPISDGLCLQFPSEGKVRGIADPDDSAMDQANRLFSLFLLCDWRQRLAKCRRCGDYFELKHWKRLYKRGIACPGCARVRSAVLSTSKARENAETALYRLVARRFGRRIAKTPNWYRDPRLRAEIIEFVNERIVNSNSLASVYRKRLTGKWLSWFKNRDGIEKALKGKVHAEG
jgi:hypothetical protein